MLGQARRILRRRWTAGAISEWRPVPDGIARPGYYRTGLVGPAPSTAAPTGVHISINPIPSPLPASTYNITWRVVGDASTRATVDIELRTCSARMNETGPDRDGRQVGATGRREAIAS